MEDRAFFRTAEVLKLLKITRSDLYTVLRPVRSQGKLLPPLFTPETKTKLTTHWLFTQRDLLKLTRYFRALKEYKSARDDLRKTGKKPDLNWAKEEDL